MELGILELFKIKKTITLFCHHQTNHPLWEYFSRYFFTYLGVDVIDEWSSFVVEGKN